MQVSHGLVTKEFELELLGIKSLPSSWTGSIKVNLNVLIGWSIVLNGLFIKKIIPSISDFWYYLSENSLQGISYLTMLIPELQFYN